VADRHREKPELVNRVLVVAGRHATMWRERAAGALDRLEADPPATNVLPA
jgi:hypothetical protein